MARQPRVDPAWQNLAGLLTNRRIALDPKYRNRRTFCDERHLDYRVISDIEGARRDNFSTHMLTAIEVGYEIADGGIRQALADPDLTELPTRTRAGTNAADVTGHPTATAPTDASLLDLDPWERDIWLSAHLTRREKEIVILLIRLSRREPVDDEGLLRLSREIGAVIDRRLERRASP